MRPSPFFPRIHLFVCANRRPADSPLGPGCGSAGEEVFARLKDEVLRSGAVSEVWVTKTHCLGICPVRGATVATYPRGRVLTEVVAGDVPALYAEVARAQHERESNDDG